YQLVKSIIKEIINKRSLDGRGKIRLDTAYLLYDRKNIDLYKHYAPLDRLQEYLEEKYIDNPEFVKIEVHEYINSNFITEIIIGFSVIFKYPIEFREESFKFFSNLEMLTEIYGLNQYLNFMILDVFGKTYSVLEDEQRK